MDFLARPTAASLLCLALVGGAVLLLLESRRRRGSDASQALFEVFRTREEAAVEKSPLPPVAAPHSTAAPHSAPELSRRRALPPLPSSPPATSPSLPARRVWDHRLVTVGICAMEKKSRSSPMYEILSRLQSLANFEIILFSDHLILERPVAQWPVVDCLISFASSGFPLEKAIEYVKLREPFLINDLEMQYAFFNRETVYTVLQQCGVPVPRFVVVKRSPGEPEPITCEQEDYIEVNGVRLLKPFVEKPVDAEDHNVYIYYPKAAGGGSKRLFRKVEDRSSQFYPDISTVRRNGSFIYEEFLSTSGTDVKVYAVGDQYAHAEARKSPAVDGKVRRDKAGKEQRYPVMLTAEEKEIARKISIAFKQTVCGFDLLRDEDRSFVCDVNGFSFVKNSPKYYDDCAQVLCDVILTHFGIKRKPSDPNLRRLSRSFVSTTDLLNISGGSREQLRCLIAVVRHGDRTPKQKIKLRVTNRKFLDLFTKLGGNPKKELKLKSANQLQAILDVTRELIALANSDVSSEEEDNQEKLYQIKDVLERKSRNADQGDHFSGINRKVQMKPTKVEERGDGEASTIVVMEVLLILKWGGELTHAGIRQAMDLGSQYRISMYPGEKPGLLRLHSSYRHDLKIYSSDEGRVQMTAAAFAKGFLELEGELTPILVSMVRKDQTATQLLDDPSASRDEMLAVKRKVHEFLSQENELDEEKKAVGAPTKSYSLLTSLAKIGNPRQALVRTYGLITCITEQLRLKLAESRLRADGRVEDFQICNQETLVLMHARWKKLEREFYNRRKNFFDISKIPDIYDCAKYDSLHNPHLELKKLGDLYNSAKALADYVVPQEYGMTANEKVSIGARITQNLLRKILMDLEAAAKDELIDIDEAVHDKHIRTRFYFTSESHLHSLINVLRLYQKADLALLVEDESRQKLNAMPEIDYMSQIVFKLFENVSVPENDERRFRVEISVSPGATQPPSSQFIQSHTARVSHRFTINDHLTLRETSENIRSVLGDYTSL
eukprot:TRINITY_DN1878_c0_g1_i1.p1 TRINITY_DN1878_c0_g1~~TRINITY_DN1878_c0_g1_i1.p1  ORF type:complete len:1006 (-),score=213.20 TRINITY_DN1878_c0_g1_i1:2009-5026(-)